MSQKQAQQPRIGLIGCGAIAESFHLPALGRHSEILSSVTLVDPDLDRAKALAGRFGVESTCGDYRELLGALDGVIVAVPAHLHLPISLECMRAGVHVLCEKPLAENPDGVRELVAAAEESGAALLVNQTRRLFPAHQQVKERIDAGELGPLRRITYAMGEPFDWPAATGGYFGARGSCKGVLLDLGAHIVDLVCWWLGREPELVDYHDDSFGGTEAVAHLDLRAGDCTASIRLSWLSKLGNTYCVEGEHGRIEGGAYEWGVMTFTDASGHSRKIRTTATHQTFDDFSARLIDNFLDVLRGTAAPLVQGHEVLDSIGVIDACYRSRKRFDMPWHDAWKTARVG